MSLQTIPRTLISFRKLMPKFVAAIFILTHACQWLEENYCSLTDRRIGMNESINQEYMRRASKRLVQNGPLCWVSTTWRQLPQGKLTGFCYDTVVFCYDTRRKFEDWTRWKLSTLLCSLDIAKM